MVTATGLAQDQREWHQAEPQHARRDGFSLLTWHESPFAKAHNALLHARERHVIHDTVLPQVRSWVLANSQRRREEASQLFIRTGRLGGRPAAEAMR